MQGILNLSRKEVKIQKSEIFETEKSLDFEVFDF
jgi:hypothetical protein